VSNPLTPLVVLGAGGHGREALDIVADINQVVPTWEVLGVLDDGAPDPSLLARVGVRHLGPTDLLADLAAAYVIGIGRGSLRRHFDERATGWGRTPATLVHPRACVGRDVVLGPGAVVAAQANVTTNIRFGRHVHVNVASTVGHDCRLADYVTIAPGARLCGTVTIGSDVFIGTGSIVIQNLTVGARTTIGAGTVVLNDLPAEVVAAGVPARFWPRRPDDPEPGLGPRRG
jgi:sugar O-acyltransferase (sialic acid O-acetyltransferase NeuD family)